MVTVPDVSLSEILYTVVKLLTSPNVPSPLEDQIPEPVSVTAPVNEILPSPEHTVVLAPAVAIIAAYSVTVTVDTRKHRLVRRVRMADRAVVTQVHVSARKYREKRQIVVDVVVCPLPRRYQMAAQALGREPRLHVIG